eukprot:2246814-Alexandrium_andersonii.AAC.1
MSANDELPRSTLLAVLAKVEQSRAWRPSDPPCASVRCSQQRRRRRRTVSRRSWTTRASWTLTQSLGHPRVRGGA